MSLHAQRLLIVQTQGSSLALDSGAVRITGPDGNWKRLPLHAIEAVVIVGDSTVTVPLLAACVKDGRLISYLGRFGKPKAVIAGPFSGRGRLRREQYRANLDEQVRQCLARQIVAGKLHNQASVLRQWARDADRPQALRVIANKIDCDIEKLLTAHAREPILGVEGLASRRYFEGLTIVTSKIPGLEPFQGRTRRPPLDPINALMSMYYGLTHVAVHGGLHSAGLDPYTGFLHGDADSQPSLVLDLMEELRPIADRAAISLLRTRQLRAEHFDVQIGGATLLNDAGRRIAFLAWSEHRARETQHHVLRQKVPSAAVPVIQAHTMANALRHRSDYVPHRLAVT